jgi:peptide/nickel transport system substrate-binding protein
MKRTFCAAIFASALAFIPFGVRAAVPDNTLAVAMPSLFEGTFLPWNGSGPRKSYLDAIYEYLAYIDPKTGDTIPGLATRWEMSPDGKIWTYWLREGVQFHGGHGEMTSADVKYSIDRMLDPKSVAGPSSALRRLVAHVEAPEKHKVVVTLKVPDIEFTRGYLSNGLVLAIVSKAYVEAKGDEEANARPVGTGPYTLTEHRRGVSVRLAAAPGSEGHWRHKPDFATLLFLAIPEEGTRVAMLRTGEADLAPINYDSVDTIKAANLRIFSIKANWAPVIRLGGLVATAPKFHNPNIPWAKKEVRQAMNYAIDRDTIVKEIFKGQARPAGADTPMAEWKDIPAYPYDPAKAKQLLAEAGYPNGFEVTLKSYATTPGAELPTIAEAVTLYWRAVGIRVKLERVDYPSVRAAWTTGRATDYVWTHRGLAFANPFVAVETTYTSKNVFASYATPEIESKVAAIANELDRGKRSALLKDVGEQLREEAAGVYLVIADEPYGASAKVAEWPTISEYGTNIEQIRRPRR